VKGRAVLSPDGKRAAGYADQTIHLWDIETAKELHCFEGHTDGICCLAYSPDGHFLASVGYDNTVRVWRVPY
jgi:WD40 repeat protein